MRYFKTVQDDPDKPDEGTPLSIHRAEDDFSKPERYDISTGKWHPNLDLIRATGIGGDDPYIEIKEKEAIAIVKQLVATLRQNS